MSKRPVIGYIVSNGVQALWADKHGVLYMNRLRATVFSSRLEAREAILKSVAYAAKRKFSWDQAYRIQRLVSQADRELPR